MSGLGKTSLKKASADGFSVNAKAKTKEGRAGRRFCRPQVSVGRSPAFLSALNHILSALPFFYYRYKTPT